MRGTDALASPNRSRLHDVGLSIAVVLAAVLVFTLEFIAWAAMDGPRPLAGREWLVAALFLLPLLLSLGGLALSLMRCPLWARWAAGVLIVVVPQIFMFGVLNA